MFKARYLAFLLFFTVLPQIGHSQASLVPVYHQVYDWLHYQRILGNAPLYNYEALPLTRGQITRLLNDITPNQVNKRDLHVRDSYLREFSVDSLKQYESNSLIQGSGKFYNRLRDIIFSDEELHTYVWDDDKANVAFDIFHGRGTVFVEDGDQNYSAPMYSTGGVRSYGSFKSNIGFHYEQWRAVQVGDNEAFDYIPFLSRNRKTLDGIAYNKHHLNTSIGYHKNIWSAHIGRGMLKHGVGSKDNLVFSRESIPFDWVRLNLDSKYINYIVLYGSLSWKPEIGSSPLEGFEGEYSRNSPQRWIVHKKIQIKPAKWISFGFYETNVFGNRGLNLSFINPINNLSIMEWEHYDKGNGIAGFEGTLRPFNGLELYAELLIDDLGDADDIFRWRKQKANNSKLARHIGASYATKVGSVFTVDYQIVEPGVYAHKFILNTYSEKGFNLGSQLGPNADEISFRFDQWLSHRFRFLFRYDYGRHGYNYFDENNQFVDVGGDLFDSYKLDENLNPRVPSKFLDGDLHRWNRYTAKIAYNPWRNIKVNAEYYFRQMLEGDRLEDISFFNFTIVVGY